MKMRIWTYVPACLLCVAIRPAIQAATVGPFPKGGGCEPPVAVLATAQGDTVRACPGDTILLDGSASVAADGHTVQQWVWNLGNGDIDTTASPFFSLALPAGGYYQVGLQVIDETGCTSDSMASVPVLVSQRPSFLGTFAPDTICPQMNAALIGIAMQPSLIPPAVFLPDSALFIPDGSGVQVLFPITISGADPDAVINTPSELGDICVSMEHSFMGDFVMKLTCPNGTSVALHQQYGGSTFLGSPVDSDDSNPIPGVCYTYCFNANPDHGTWAACSQSGPTPNVIPYGDGWNVSLAPGSYTPVDSLSNLVGCPVNGTWTFSIVDFWGQDNGFVCSMSIGLQALPGSDMNPLGPQLNLASPDSSFWTGGGLAIDSSYSGAAVFTPSGTGTEQFTYHVIDSYGCAYDTTVSIAVVPMDAPLVDFGDGSGELCVSNTFGATYDWYLNGVFTGFTGPCWTPDGSGMITVIATDANGCTSSTEALPTGMAGSSDGAFSILVRPTADHHVLVTMKVPDNRAVQLQLLDVSGRLVTERRANPSGGHIELELGTQLASGSYILHALQTGRQVVERVVVP